METRTEPFLWDKYQITGQLLDLPHCKVYAMAEIDRRTRFFLVECEWESARDALKNELELWLSAGDYPFPAVVEKREEAGVRSIVCRALHGVTLESLVGMGMSQLQEAKVFSFFYELKNVMEGMFRSRVEVGNPALLTREIYFSPDREAIRLLPRVLIEAVDKNAAAIEPAVKVAEPQEEGTYVRAFGILFCYLLTRSLPKDRVLLPNIRTLLQTDTADLLDALLGGNLQTFQEVEGAFRSLLARREKTVAAAREQQVQQWKLEERKESLARRAAPIIKAGRRIGGILVQSLFLVLRAAYFLVFLVGTYYWEQGIRFLKWCGTVWIKARRLTWSDLRTYFRAEARRARQDILQMRISAAMLFPVPDVDLLHFTRHLATLLQAGVSFTYSLKVLHQQTTNMRLKNALSIIYGEVVGKGLPLSQAMRQTRKVFPELYINMVGAGEVTGRVGEVLHQIADYLERSLLLKKKIQGAATYPVVIAVACFGLFSFFVYIILPKLIAIFQGLQIREYPLPTRILMAIVKFAHSPMTILLVIVGGIVSFFPLMGFIQSLVGKARIDRTKLGIPTFGKLYKKVLLARFCSTLGTMVRCGVPLLSAFEVTGRASGNEFFNEITAAVIEKVRVGRTLASIVEEEPFFPPLVLSMVQVGEESGNLEAMLIKLAEIYDDEVAYLLQQFVSLIEPLLMAAMGFVVGFVVLAIFMPIYAIVGGIR